jgi:2-polyprenyl-6-methoxyphenol hydroxylase-like FAD-dependent oxidoreductase
MHPDQPPIHWGGAIMWRGTTQRAADPDGVVLCRAGVVDRQRMVIYPISHARSGRPGSPTVNWIAEVTVDPEQGWQSAGWFKPVEIGSFLHHFEGWRYDWLDVPALIAGADIAYENPMIDRDPIPSWVDGPVALMGDAAHAMYPTGSNGASQAIVDARELGAALLAHGVTPAALKAYDDKLAGPVGEVVLRNRGAGPFGLLNLVDERCGGSFENIDDVIPPEERAAFMAGYKAAAGFAIETLNAAPPTIAPGARIGA